MKKFITLVSLVTVAGGLLLSGCSKPKKPAASSAGGNADASAASVAADDSPAEMKFKWTAGKTYPMRLEFTQETETKVPNQPEPVKQEVKLRQSYNYSALKALANGGWETELEFVSQTMDVMQGGRSVLSFDSAQSPAPDTKDPLTTALAGMIGGKVKYITDADGNVEKVDDSDLMKHVAATGNPQAQTLFKQQLFNEDTLKRYGAFADMMPNRMVKVGESWSVKKDITSTIGTLTVDMKFTFKNWEQHGDRKCAHIDQTGDISTKTVSAANVGAAVEIEKGKVTGDMLFDPAQGMIVNVNNDQNLTLKITTRQQKMTQQLDQTVRLAVLDAP